MRYLAFVVALFVFACGEDPDPTPKVCPVGTFGGACASCDSGFFCDGKGEALACADGAWDDDADPATPCVSWSTCPAGSAPQGGSSTSDVGCEPCPNGTFSVGSAACTNWTECVAGQWLVAEANAESDRRCQICSVLEYDHDSDPATACVSCDSGYRGTTDRLSCVNIDECADNSTGCAQNCTDTDGSYTCSCNNGYTLASDGLGCDGNTYTVTLHYEDGDTADTTLQVTFGAPYGTLPEPTRTGYDFDGWWTASGGSGSQAHAITEVVIAEHHQLYAHWVFTRSLSVSAGAEHTCVVESDGTVWCSGRNIVGELGDGTTTPSATPVQVLGLTGAKTVSVGNLHHTCAVKVDGSVWCWGNNGFGRLGDGTTTHSAIPVQVQGLTDVTDLSAGSYHTCAVKTEGSVWCWGAGSYGQLGDGTYTQKTTPVQVPGLTGATALSAGYFYTCAVKSDQTVWCWGNGQYGQLGNGNTTSTRLAQVAGLIGVKAVSAGYYHACALKADQRVWCWGANWGGLLGDGTIGQKNTPVLVSGLGAKAVSAGNNFTCAVKMDGSTWCWGYNDEGQLGDGTTTKSRVPVPALGLTQATGVSAGEFHACVVKMDGSTWCWGENRYGQLARLSPAPHNLPGQVDGLNADVLTLSGRNNHTCSVKIDGTVWCWGRNDNGQLGDGSTTTSVTPVQVIGLAGAVDVSFGGSNCALMSDETVWCWGSNGSGQLGDGTTINRSIPVQVSGLTGATSVSSGSHACAVKTDGTTWCWGANWQGQLGNGTTGNTGGTTSSRIPLEVLGLTGATAVRTGDSHTCALTADETVWCWGLNADGQLGDGTTNTSPIPVEVSGLTGAAAVSVGAEHTCALKADETVWCWGLNVEGQLGNGTIVSSPIPVQVSGLTGATVLSAGREHSCAVKNDGSAWCWGKNRDGQLGDGSNIHTTTPVQVSTVSGLSGSSILSAGTHTCAVKTDGSAWCWGAFWNERIGRLTYTVIPLESLF